MKILAISDPQGPFEHFPVASMPADATPSGKAPCTRPKSQGEKAFDLVKRFVHYHGEGTERTVRGTFMCIFCGQENLTPGLNMPIKHADFCLMKAARELEQQGM